MSPRKADGEATGIPLQPVTLHSLHKMDSTSPAPKNDQIQQPAATAKPQRNRRRWLFRALAVGLSLLPLVLVEFALHLADLGDPLEQVDPFVGFQGTSNLFVLNEESDAYEIPKSRLPFFAPESFPVDKPAGGRRVFCLGGSTVQGRPYSKETSFTTWLELALSAADDAHPWNVINCGGISYASYRLIPILEEVLGYDPDLIVICTGHNEFLEDRTYDHLKQGSSITTTLHSMFSGLRTYNVLRSFMTSEDEEKTRLEGRPLLPVEVDALLDHRGGLEVYRRDDQWKESIIEHFEFNLRRLVGLANRAGVPVVLILPPSNLADCPPFKSEHRTDLTDEELKEYQRIVNDAWAMNRRNVANAVGLWREALQIDREHAFGWYVLGQCLDELGQRDEARQAFLKARELDVCPLRIVAPMEDAIRDVADDTRTPMVDAFRLLEDQRPTSVLGDSMLVDHVHPTFHGHQLIANELVAVMRDMGLVTPKQGWESVRQTSYKAHMDSLKVSYFFKGNQMLEALRYWASGRVEGDDLDTSNPLLRRVRETGDDKHEPVE